MATPAHYRAKADEQSELARLAVCSEDARKFSERERSFRTLADNEQWLIDHGSAVQVAESANEESRLTTEDV